MAEAPKYKIGDVVNVPAEYGTRMNGIITNVLGREPNRGWQYKVQTNLHFKGDDGYFSEREIRLGKHFNN